MKTSYKKILVLAMAVTALTAFAAYGGKEKEEESIWHANEPNRVHKWFELTDEGIEHIMERLAESKPEKAKELAELREKDPEKFKVELRKVMREHFREKFRQHREERAGRKHWRGPNTPYTKPYTPRMPHGRHERMIRRMSERHAEYLRWLEENYPDEANKLAKFGDKKPELYMRKHGRGFGKHKRIFEASKENPRLAKVLKEDLELRKQRDELVDKIKAADDAAKKELTAELEDVLSARFDLIVKRRELAYEQMLKKLEKVKEEVKKSEAQVENWKAPQFKKENIKAHLEELISGTKKFSWD